MDNKVDLDGFVMFWDGLWVVFWGPELLSWQIMRIIPKLNFKRLVSALLKSYRHQLVRHSRYDLGEAFGSFWGCIWVVLKSFKMVFVCFWTLLVFSLFSPCQALYSPWGNVGTPLNRRSLHSPNRFGLCRGSFKRSSHVALHNTSQLKKS